MEAITALQPSTLLTNYIKPNPANGELGIVEYGKYKALERGLTVKDTLKLPIVQNISRRLGEAEVMKLLYIVVEEGVRPFKVVHKMDQRDIIDFCSDYMDIHRTETLEDLVIFFKKARAGAYGEAFNRLDGPTLLDWFKVYLEEKAQAREDHIKNAKHQINDSLTQDKGLHALAKRYSEQSRPATVEEEEAVKGLTMEKHTEALEADLHIRTDAELSALFRSMGNSNRFGSYDGILALINQELETRYDNGKKEA